MRSSDIEVPMKRTSLALASLLAMAGVALHLGCIILPSTSREVIDNGHAWVADRGDRNVKAGISTKEAVLGLLGKPDLTLADGRLLAYTWRTHNTLYKTWVLPMVCANYDADRVGSDSFIHEETQFLLLEFDAAGTLLQKQLHHGGSINIYAHGINDAIQ
jgi:hypothetical protein